MFQDIKVYCPLDSFGGTLVDIRYMLRVDEYLFSIKSNSALLTIHKFWQITVSCLLKQFHTLHLCTDDEMGENLSVTLPHAAAGTTDF